MVLLLKSFNPYKEGMSPTKVPLAGGASGNGGSYSLSSSSNVLLLPKTNVCDNKQITTHNITIAFIFLFFLLII